MRTASPGGLVDWCRSWEWIHGGAFSDGPKITTFPTSRGFWFKDETFHDVSWVEASMVLIDGCGIHFEKKVPTFLPLKQHQCLESAWFPSWECFILVRKLCVYTAKGFHSGHTAQEQIKDLKTEIARPWKGCRTFVLLECANYVKIHH